MFCSVWLRSPVFVTRPSLCCRYATDALNCLQGVLTFVIFVLNRPVRQEIRARVVQLRARRAARLEYRVADEPQIDDFQTVVQRQSRLSARLSPWQEQEAKSPGPGPGADAERQALRDDDTPPPSPT